MQKLKIPQILDIEKSAVQKLAYQGVLGRTAFVRLSESTISICSDINVKIATGFDAQGLKYLQGQCTTTIEIACERCRNPMQLTLDADFSYIPVLESDDIRLIPSCYEVLEVERLDNINVVQFIEDELILALPMIARHDLNDCVAPQEQVFGEIKEDSESLPEHPFAKLKQLKRN